MKFASKINIIILPIICLALIGCGSKELEVKNIEEQNIKLNMKEPAPLYLEDIEFSVITKNNQAKVFSDLEKQSKDTVLFGLSDEDYKKLSLNMQLIKSYIIEQQNIIKSYKEFYESK